MKKLLSLVLCAALLVAATPATPLPTRAASADSLTYEFDDDTLTATVIGCDQTATDVEIPSTVVKDGKTYTVTAIGKIAFCFCVSLTSVTIPDGVTSIEGSAFHGCESLVNITLPNSVTSIGTEAFYNCKSLTGITLPDSVTSIGDSAFFGCENLASIVIPDGVTSIEPGLFYWCTNLTSVTLPNSVTSIGGGAFLGCESLTDITLPDSLTTIFEMTFSGCAFTNITIPDGVTNICTDSFTGCMNLIEITIPDSVTSIASHAFAYCENLTDIYYGGTEQDRAAMMINEANDPLLNATWHYAQTSCSHEYDNEYDIDCNLCGAIREVGKMPTISVDSVTVRLDKTFMVAVRLNNNTGIVSAKLAISYDESKLELLSYEEQDFTDLSYGPDENNPFIVNWCDPLNDNVTADGVFVLLTFRAKADAEVGETVISVSYDPEDVYDYDFENVTFDTVSGTVNIIEYVSGDLDDDDVINNKDLGLLERYVNGWAVGINELAADVNGDGAVNNKDLGILQRHINGWDTILGTTTTQPTTPTTATGSIVTTAATTTTATRPSGQTSSPAATTTTYNGQATTTPTTTSRTLNTTTTTKPSTATTTTTTPVWSPFG